jgi:lipoprotein LprG
MAVAGSGWVRRVSALAIGALLVLGAAGCGDEVKPVDISPDEVVKKASEAIQKPQTFHFSVSTENMHKLPGLWLIEAEGDAVKPDKMVGKVSGRYNNLSFNAEIVVDGKSQYWTDPLNKRWGTMPNYLNVTQFFDPAKGVSDILAGLKNPTVEGAEKVNDTETYRLKGTVPPASLQAITPEVNVKTEIPTTVWVGRDDFLIRRVHLQGPLIEGEPENVGRTINVSDFDKVVTVETPMIPK